MVFSLPFHDVQDSKHFRAESGLPLFNHTHTHSYEIQFFNGLSRFEPYCETNLFKGWPLNPGVLRPDRTAYFAPQEFFLFFILKIVFKLILKTKKSLETSKRLYSQHQFFVTTTRFVRKLVASKKLFIVKAPVSIILKGCSTRFT